jgi:hypothetical protein
LRFGLDQYRRQVPDFVDDDFVLGTVDGFHHMSARRACSDCEDEAFEAVLHCLFLGFQSFGRGYGSFTRFVALGLGPVTAQSLTRFKVKATCPSVTASPLLNDFLVFERIGIVWIDIKNDHLDGLQIVKQMDENRTVVAII